MKLFLLTACCIATGLFACVPGGALVESEALPNGSTPTANSPTATSPLANSALTGVWDITGSSAGARPVNGTVEITSTRFVVEIGGSKLAFEAGSAGTKELSGRWQSETQSTAIVTSRTPGTGDIGAIPFPLLGAWTFKSADPDDDTKCSGGLQPPLFTATCTEVSGSPSSLPNPQGGVVANRIDTRKSSFGDLGGRWELGANLKGCFAMFENESVSFNCDKKDAKSDVTITFTDKMATGSSTASKTQFSGLKR